MLNLVSLVIGVVALILAAVAFMPLLGWANWFILPLAVIGAGVGQMSNGSRAGPPGAHSPDYPARLAPGASPREGARSGPRPRRRHHLLVAGAERGEPVAPALDGAGGVALILIVGGHRRSSP